MALSVSVKSSSDTMNGLTLGTDAGLWSGGAPARGGQYNITIDNSWTPPDGSTKYWYTLPSSGAVSYAGVANTAFVWPIMFSRACRVVDLLAGLTTNAAGGATFNTSVYAMNSTTGLPGAKLTDLARLDCSSVNAAKPHTITAPNFTFAPGTIYWLASWMYTISSYSAIQMRTASANSPFAPLRVPSVPTTSVWWGGGFCNSLADTSVTWSTLTSAPATLSPTQPTVTAAPAAPYVYAPLFWWGLVNV